MAQGETGRIVPVFDHQKTLEVKFKVEKAIHGPIDFCSHGFDIEDEHGKVKNGNAYVTFPDIDGVYCPYCSLEMTAEEEIVKRDKEIERLQERIKELKKDLLDANYTERRLEELRNEAEDKL